MGHCLFMRKGEVHTAPVTGVLASSLAVGSTVKLMEGGTAVEYLVVNQGIPSNSNLYDASCDGTWLLRKDIHSNQVWNNRQANAYADSTINTWLNGTFFNSFGSVEQSTIKQVKIPYRNNGGSGGTTQQGANGLLCKVFLLSAPEVHYENVSIDSGEGAALNYFASCSVNNSDPKRVASRSGSAANWWLRSPSSSETVYAWAVYADGNCSRIATMNASGVRPAVILPGNALFDETTMLLKGVK